VSLVRCTLSNNAAGQGGGLHNHGTVTLTDCYLAYNAASNNVHSNNGGGLFNGKMATLTNCTLTGNTAGTSGGSIETSTSSTTTLTNCILTSNAAGSSGGGLAGGDLATLTLTDCAFVSNSAGDSGGGLTCLGTTTLTNCTLANNTAGESGGGLFNNGEMATLTNCIVMGNSATDFGGGLYLAGTATVANSTLASNTVSGDGGGIFSIGQVTLLNCTLASNAATSSGGGSHSAAGTTLTVFSCTLADNSAADGGGIRNGDQATVVLINTIVANSRSGADISSSGEIAGAFNLIGDGTGGSELIGTITGDPRLGPLQFNGGPTPTMALLPDSPALNTGLNAFVATNTDQRGPGFPRVYGGTVDIGAFELQDSPPVPLVAGPLMLAEGGNAVYDASGTTDAEQDPASLTYEWDFDGDGQYDDATGINPTFSAAALDGLDGSTATVGLRVTDSGGLVNFATLKVAIENVPPTASVTGPTSGVRAQPSTFTLSASDPSATDQAAGFTYAIDWDGDGTSDQTIGPGAPSPTTITHSYDQLGTYTVRATATDKDGGTSLAATHVIEIKVLDLQDDPGDAGTAATALVVGGTTGDDTIVFNPSMGSANAVTLLLNGVRLGSFAGLTRLVAYGGSGDDSIQVAGAIRLPTLLDGGAGDDRVNGGNGQNIVLGGAGADILKGGNDRDILIGGLEADTIDGNGGDDILIGGTTAWDGVDRALCALMDEWSRADADYSARIGHLRDGRDGGRNGSFLLDSGTVFDDAAVDELIGAAGADWYFARTTGVTPDRLSDRKPAELLTEPS
jgi:hypothetical protein